MSKSPPPNPTCSICHKAILPGAGRSRRAPTGMHIECEKTKQYRLAEPDVQTKGPSLPGGTIGSLLRVPPVPRSAKMQALIEKIEAADVAHFAALRAKGKAQSDALAKARAKTLERKRETLRMAREIQSCGQAQDATARRSELVVRVYSELRGFVLAHRTCVGPRRAEASLPLPLATASVSSAAVG